MPELIPAAPGTPVELADYDCCHHCKHDARYEQHNPPHATPCDHGCNDDEVDQEMADAEARWSAIEGADD